MARTLRFIGILFLLVFSNASCTKGSLHQFAVETTFLKNTQIRVVDYGSSTAQVQIDGTLADPSWVRPDQMVFYPNSVCDGSPLATISLDTFLVSGVQVDLPLDQVHNLHLRLQSDTRCFNVGTIDTNIQTVNPATLISISPTSPSTTSTTPVVMGSAFPSQAAVRFYRDAACTDLITTSTRAQFQGAGVVLNLTANLNNRVYARVTDPRGQESTCDLLTEYRHIVSTTPAPVFTQANPPSPSRMATGIKLKGTLDNSIAQVRIYRDPSCQTLTAEGTAAIFKSSGIEIQVPENSLSTFYAISLDGDGLPSSCVLLTNYQHDSIPPGPPDFSMATPASPTRLTTLPRIGGTAPTDAVEVRLYNNPNCLTNQNVGFGTKTIYESVGIVANLVPNSTTSLYGQALDAAGNASNCVLLTSYKHNTIPPTPPIFFSTNPASPTNQTTQPLVLGVASETTVHLEFYSDLACTQLIGQGPPDTFQNPGIRISLPGNATTTFYAVATDPEGNRSECTSLGSFAHSTNPAPAPTFVLAVPPSPTRVTDKPIIIGSAPATIQSVELHGDSSCTTLLGSGSRITFSTAGLQTTLTPNSANEIYAKSKDIYGNDSPCVSLTTYIHANLPPPPPTLTNYSPLSPNNVSFSPTLVGTAGKHPGSPLTPHQISFYDTDACVSKFGEGSRADFLSTGITITVPSNTVNSIYAKSFDQAQNSSACTFLTQYVYDNLVPGHPTFLSFQPTSPSYSSSTRLKGGFAPSPDFLPIAEVQLHDNPSCSNALASGSPATFQSTGLPLTVPLNTTTALYGRSVNVVGTQSTCQLLSSFRHHDLPPQNLTISDRSDGSFQLNWFPETVPQPTPTYSVRRSLSATGPFTIIASGLNSPSYVDARVDQGRTYFYRVQAGNNSGLSQLSTIVSRTVAAPVPTGVISVIGIPGFAAVTLTWSGAPQVSYYKVLRSSQPGGPYTTVGDRIESTTFLDETVSNGQTYYYVVQGINPQGESPLSLEIRVTPLDQPSPPTGLSMTPLLQNPDCANAPGLRLSWLPAVYQSGYEVYSRSITSNQSYTLAGTVTVPTRSICSGTNGYLYNYQVRARWGSFSTTPSNDVFFVWTGGPNLVAHSGDNIFYLQWQLPNGATALNLYRATNPTGPYSLIASQISANDYTDTSVVNGVAYYYYAQGLDGSTLVGWPSAVVSGVPGPPPGPPTLLKLSVESSMPSLSWVAPSHFSRFLIYRSATSGGPYTFVGQSTSTQFQDSAPTAGVNHYVVRAQWGNTESASSNEVVFQNSQITDLTATANSSQINLSWSAVPGVNGYRILRGSTRLGSKTSLAVTTSTSYSDLTAVVDTGYFYEVIPLFPDSTEGMGSNIVGAMLSGGSRAPSGLGIESTTSTSISLSWAPVVGATQYRIRIATSLAGPYTLAATVGSTVQTSLVASLNPGTTYFLRVGAVVSGTEYASDSILAVTASKPMAPTGIPSQNRIDLEWSPSSGSTSYSVLRSTDNVNFSVVASDLSVLAYSDVAVTNGQLYFYRIRVHWNSFTLDSDTSPGLVPGLTPRPPSMLTVSRNNDGVSVQLSWPRESSATAYNVYKSLSPAGPFVTPELTTSATTGVTVSGLTAGVTYYFKVSSLNGLVESALSQTLGVIPLVSPPKPQVLAQSNGSVDVSWAAVPAATSYDILRSEDGGFAYLPVATGLTGLSYSDSTVGPDRTYIYKIRPFSSSDWMADSLPSDPIVPFIVPLPPQNLRIQASNLTSIQLDWSPVSNVTGYEILRSTTSGSGFTSVGTVNAPLFSFSDTGLTTGVTYYYQIRSFLPSGRTSSLTPEVQLSLTGPPSGVALSDLPSSIQVQWNSVPGATSYRVYRSDRSGGPFGFTTEVNTLSWLDSQVLPSRPYYYTVSAVFSGTIESSRSTEVSIIKTGGLNLVQKIELLDRGVSSLAGADQTFQRSLTLVDSQDFDGTLNTRFEVITRNTDSSNRFIRLLNSANNTVASINVPAGSSSFIRMEIPMTLSSGAQNYRIQLEQTSSSNQLQVQSAKIIVGQTGASRTRIYVPLLSSDLSPSAEDLEAPSIELSDTNLQVPVQSFPYIRNTNALAKLKEFNPWSLHLVTSASNGATGTLQLQNLNTQTSVGSTTTDISGPSFQSAEVPFQEGTSSFQSTNEGHLYALALQCLTNCQTGFLRVYRAYLTIKLENLTRAQVIQRISGAGFMGSTSYADRRFQSDLKTSEMTNPTAFWQVAGVSSGSTDALVQLSSAGLSDSTLTSLSPVASASLSGWTASPGIQSLRSPAVSGLSSDHRYATEVQISSGGFQLSGSAIVINIEH